MGRVHRDRSPFFADRLLRYVNKYNGIAVHTETITVRLADGAEVEKPVMIVYEVRREAPGPARRGRGLLALVVLPGQPPPGTAPHDRPDDHDDDPSNTSSC